MKVCIIGMGRCGSSIAFALLMSRKIKTIYCDDIDKKRLIGEIEDLKDASSILNSSEIKPGFSEDCDVYIISAGFPREDSSISKKNLIELNEGVVESIMRKIPKDRKVIIVTNPSDYFAKKYKAIEGGEILDRIRHKRTRGDPERVAEKILDNKGYTNWGISAEILKRLR
jgi:malate/lactate dehydrogenase